MPAKIRARAGGGSTHRRNRAPRRTARIPVQFLKHPPRSWRKNPARRKVRRGRRARRNPMGIAGSGRAYRPTYRKVGRFAWRRPRRTRPPKGWRPNPAGAYGRGYDFSAPRLTVQNAVGVVAGGFIGWFGPGIGGFLVATVARTALDKTDVSATVKEGIVDAARLTTKTLLGKPIIGWVRGAFDREAGKVATWAWGLNLGLDFLFTGIKWLTAGGEESGGFLPIKSGAAQSALTVSGLGHVIKAPTADLTAAPIVEEQPGWFGNKKYRVKDYNTGRVLFMGNEDQTDKYMAQYGYTQLQGYVHTVS